MKVTIERYPTDEDWMWAKRCALVTIGKEAKIYPDVEWKTKILAARHSPIRTLMFLVRFEDIPYYVSTHLVRHVHAQPFIKTQRNDRQDNYDRNNAPQNAPVDMLWWFNAEELLTIAEKRLCLQADKTTRAWIEEMCKKIIEMCPEFRGLFNPPCVRLKHCQEMFPCYREV